MFASWNFGTNESECYCESDESPPLIAILPSPIFALRVRHFAEVLFFCRCLSIFFLVEYLFPGLGAYTWGALISTERFVPSLYLFCVTVFEQNISPKLPNICGELLCALCVYHHANVLAWKATFSQSSFRSRMAHEQRHSCTKLSSFFFYSFQWHCIS